MGSSYIPSGKHFLNLEAQHIQADEITVATLNLGDSGYAQVYDQPAIGSRIIGNGLVANFSLQGGKNIDFFIIGARTSGQTAFLPVDANGLELELSSDADGDGAELNFGATAAGLHQFVIGTAPAFEFEVVMRSQDVTNMGPLYIGFRGVQANQAVFADYEDVAALGANATEFVSTVTALNDAAHATVASTVVFADATDITLTVRVSATGAVTFWANGAALTPAPAAFTFDDGDTVLPFIHFIQTVGDEDVINLKSLRVAPQSVH